MPRVRVPDGRVVEFPDGMSQDAMAEALNALPPAEPQAAPAAPAGGLPPDIQQRFEHPFGLPKMPVAPASMAAPGAGILGNMAGQAAAGAGEALVGGKGPLQAGKEALGGALGGGAGSLLGKAAGFV